MHQEMQNVESSSIMQWLQQRFLHVSVVQKVHVCIIFLENTVESNCAFGKW